MLINWNYFYSVFCLHFCLLIEKITKGKKTPMSLLEYIFMGWQIFRINTENAAKEATYFDVFYVQ